MWPYFERSRELLGTRAMDMLAGMRVAVVGLGGVGGFAAEALVRAGVGAVTLVDPDVVEPSNLNRQLAALHSTLGMTKTEILASRAKDINPGVQIRAMTMRYQPDTRDIFFDTTYDGIIDAIDTVSCKLDLIEQALNRRIPIVSALGTGHKTNAFLLRVGDIAQTEGCPLARVVRRELRKRGVLHHRVIWSPECRRAGETADAAADNTADAAAETEARRKVPASISWVPACAGFMLAGDMVMRLIGGERAENTPK